MDAVNVRFKLEVVTNRLSIDMEWINHLTNNSLGPDDLEFISVLTRRSVELGEGHKYQDSIWYLNSLIPEKSLESIQSYRDFSVTNTWSILLKYSAYSVVPSILTHVIFS